MSFVGDNCRNIVLEYFVLSFASFTKNPLIMLTEVIVLVTAAIDRELNGNPFQRYRSVRNAPRSGAECHLERLLTNLRVNV